MLSRQAARVPFYIQQAAISSTPSSCLTARPLAAAGSSRQAVVAGVAGAAASSGETGPSTSNPLISWVISNGGAVNGVGMANLAGSDGGAGWGLVATQVSTFS